MNPTRTRSCCRCCRCCCLSCALCLLFSCQAERYREALADLRYMLRLEPPPAKGVPVSKDILDVQKMAKECEQKVCVLGSSIVSRVCLETQLEWAWASLCVCMGYA